MTITIQADDETEDRKYEVTLSDEDMNGFVTVSVRPVQRKHEEDAEFERDARGMSFDVYASDLRDAAECLDARNREREIMEKK